MNSQTNNSTELNRILPKRQSHATSVLRFDEANGADLTKTKRLDGDSAQDVASISSRDLQIESLRLDESMKSPRRLRFAIALVLIVGLVAGLLRYRQAITDGLQTWISSPSTSGYETTHELPQLSSSQSSTTPAETTEPLATVATTETTNSSNFQADFESRGYVVARRRILVSPQVLGRILKFSIQEGDSVQAGEVLAEIEKTEYQLAVDEAKAAMVRHEAEWSELKAGSRQQEIAAAEAEIDEQVARLKKSESDFRRQQDMMKQGVTTESEYQDAESNLLSLKSKIVQMQQRLSLLKEGPRKEQIDRAAAMVLEAKATYEKAMWRLENCTVRSPISGIVLRKTAEEGNLINASAFNGSFSLCEIADLSYLEVETAIQERDLSKVAEGQACQIVLDAYPSEKFNGKVNALMPIADRARGSITIRIGLESNTNVTAQFRPDMSAKVSFLGNK